MSINSDGSQPITYANARDLLTSEERTQKIETNKTAKIAAVIFMAISCISMPLAFMLPFVFGVSFLVCPALMGLALATVAVAGLILFAAEATPSQVELAGDIMGGAASDSFLSPLVHPPFYAF